MIAYGKVRLHTQVVNPAKEELQLPVRRTWSVLRDHVAAQVDRAEGQAALGVPAAENTGACKRAVAQLAVVWDLW